MTATQQDSVAVLPPLPEPRELRNYTGNVPFAYYTAEQMRAYALQSQQGASADRGEVARPSQEWYRGRIMETLDDEPGVIGGGFVAGWFRCSNPERGHLHPTDPVGPCPECVAEGSGNWSCISAAVPLPAGSVATPPSPAAPSGVSDADALATFTDYFVRNYPGPDTIISDPKWHAPRIFRAAQHALEAAQPQPGRVEGIPLDDETRDILGRPNFTLIHIANALRKSGMTIEPRAEAEQAACLHWMLNLYLQHGAGWRAAAQAHLEAAPTASSQEADHGSL